MSFYRGGRQGFSGHPDQSGVALRLPPQSKTLRAGRRVGRRCPDRAAGVTHRPTAGWGHPALPTLHEPEPPGCGVRRQSIVATALWFQHVILPVQQGLFQRTAVQVRKQTAPPVYYIFSGFCVRGVSWREEERKSGHRIDEFANHLQVLPRNWLHGIRDRR
jgi:hypothetical protein